MNDLDVQGLYLQYLQLGEGRTYTKLGTITGRSPDSLRKLAARHGWKEKLEKDTEALKQQYSLSDLENMGAGELLAVTNRAALDKLAYSVHTIQPKTVRDSRLLLDIYQLLASRPTAATEAPATDDNRVSVAGILDLIEDILTPQQQAEFYRRIEQIAELDD